jgi:rRNA maturation endonuclease Nob1
MEIERRTGMSVHEKLCEECGKEHEKMAFCEKCGGLSLQKFEAGKR